VEVEPDISPHQIGGFRIIRRLSSGATTDVLLARAEGPHGFERVVALKVLLQQFRSDPAFERMFAREASAYARLSHPAIVKLYDFFSADGQLVMVLEYIDGLPLHRLRAMLSIEGERLEDAAAYFIGSRIFAALAAAHSARDPESGEFSPVIHRDINPSNVLVPWDGHVKIADFGIAKIGNATGDTRLGFVKGTYGYMAPEQVRGEAVTVRADVYAGTLVLWELLARRKAIQRGSLPEVEVLKAMAKPEFPSLDALRPDVPADIREIVKRGLEPDAERRAVTAEEMASALRRVTKGDDGRAMLASAMARVRPAPTSEALAVTQAQTRPSQEIAAATFAVASPVAETPAAGTPSSRDPDATQPFNALDLPEDSGAFKRSDIRMQPSELEDLVSGDPIPEDAPRSLSDLTLVEARRPTATDPPPTTKASSELPGPGPSTLPLPGSLPEPDRGPSLLGVVRTEGDRPHPETLRFGEASEGPKSRGPASPPSTRGYPPAPQASPPSHRPVPRPTSSRPHSPRLPPAKSDLAQTAATPAAPPASKAPPSSGPPSVPERTLVSPFSKPALPVATVPKPHVELSPTLVSPSRSVFVAADTPPSASPPAASPPPPPGTAAASAGPTATPASEPPAGRAAVQPNVLPAPAPASALSPPTVKIDRLKSPPQPAARSGFRWKTWLMSLVVIGGSGLLGMAAVELYFGTQEAAAPRAVASATSGASSSASPPSAQPASDPARASASASAPSASSSAAASPAASAAHPTASASALASASPAAAAPASAQTASAPPVPRASSAATTASSGAPNPAPALSATPAGTDPGAAAAWQGSIFTAPSLTGHRIFVEGRVVGESPGPYQVRCGTRSIQVGSAGTARDVNVPCGGSVQVTP
jgi:eukaryotic-like serine/threonine-protein kinase